MRSTATNVAHCDTNNCIRAATFAFTRGSFALNVAFQVLLCFVFRYILWWTEK
jgi:hypothetical protein